MEVALRRQIVAPVGRKVFGVPPADPGDLGWIHVVVDLCLSSSRLIVYLHFNIPG